MWTMRPLGLHWREKQHIPFHPSLNFKESVATNTLNFGFYILPRPFLPLSLFHVYIVQLRHRALHMYVHETVT